jgi:flagellar motor switch protein FliN/FliY
MAETENERALARFYDIPIELSVELDRRVMKVREILSLQTGAVIKMNRSAGDNMSLLFHGVLVGYGEIVVIEDTIGIRVTDIVPE